MVQCITYLNIKSASGGKKEKLEGHALTEYFTNTTCILIHSGNQGNVHIRH